MKSLMIRMTLLIAAVSIVSSVVAEVQQVPVVRLETSLTIDASPTQVWSYMISGKNVGWCPYWGTEANEGHRDLAQVGDVLEYVDGWGGGGRSIVTYIDPGKELRIAHEPNDGSYVCQSKLILSPVGSGTTVRYVEQYTDESDAPTMSATAEKMRVTMESTLATIRDGVEGS